jgi:hypothetical protein
VEIPSITVAAIYQGASPPKEKQTTGGRAMAELVLGLVSSHSPQLSTPPEAWALRGENDKRNPALIGADGIVSGYEELLARTDVPRIAK